MYKVLIVSNNDISEKISDMFPKGSSVSVASTLKNGLMHASMRWDAVLLDIDMKGEEAPVTSIHFDSQKTVNDSYAFLKEAKDVNPANEIIVFSQSRDAKKCIKAMAYGPYNYLIYPFEKSSLLSLVDEICADDKQLNKDIENLAHKYFIDDLDDRKGLFSELIHTRRMSGSFVSRDEFLAFFPMHERDSERTIEVLREFVGEGKLKDLPVDDDPPVVLVVEDELHVREGVVDILIDNGFETLEAEDGDKAVEVAKQAEKIDLNLLDIGLPKKSGIELIPILRDIHPDSETIMLTAFADQINYVISCMKDRAYDYITKPYDKNDLLAKISKAIQKKYFRQMMPQLGKTILDKKLSAWSKFKILTDIAHKRQDNKRHLLMKDIYLFFPELEQSKIPKNKALTEQIVDDGILLFADFLSRDIQEGKDCKRFIENWEKNF